MKMIVGLGNVGRQYRNTRHNIGFMVAEELAQRFNIKFRRNLWLRAKIARFFSPEGKKEVLIICPSTYMNLSGKSIRKAKDKFSLPLENLLVICDDVNLPFGKLRLRPKGGDGGHKGLLSLIKELEDDNFNRLRIGVGKSEDKSLEQYVLEEFSPPEQKELGKIIEKAEDIVLSWVEQGVDKTMNRFN